MTNIPIYRAKKIDSDEYVFGSYIYIPSDSLFVIGKHSCEYAERHYITNELTVDFVPEGYADAGKEKQHFLLNKIDPSTLAIHFTDMLDSQGNKIFASLNEDGKGGSLVISKCYPFYGDAPEITESSGKCEELNYIGVIITDGISTFIEYIKVSDRVNGGAIGYILESNELISFEVIGVNQ